MLGSKLLALLVQGRVFTLNKRTSYCLGKDECTVCGNRETETMEQFFPTCPGCEG